MSRPTSVASRPASSMQGSPSPTPLPGGLASTLFVPPPARIPIDQYSAFSTPSARYGHACAAIPHPQHGPASTGDVLLVGGVTGDGTSLMDVHLLTLAPEGEGMPRWTPIPCNATPHPQPPHQLLVPSEAPTPRHYHSVVIYGRLAYVFGGWNGEDIYSSMYVLDLDTYHWWQPPNNTTGVITVPKDDMAPPPEPVASTPVDPAKRESPLPRQWHNACMLGNTKYICYFGSWGVRAEHQVHLFNTETMAWIKPKPKGDIPPSLYGHSACGMDQSPDVYVFGGSEGAVGRSNLVRHLHFEGDGMSQAVWTTIAQASAPGLPQPRARTNHAACICGTYMYISGGWDDIRHLDDIWALNLRPSSPPFTHPTQPGVITHTFHVLPTHAHCSLSVRRLTHA
ncbi:hypothetical protein PAPYR_11113 [Paratrimastix pyriformis]|uniref:Galactose oxidase n=1 Tax=Paratrimastix pyriformis TaxID=342808 RepID=A0ABQ8U9H0_9EUKA|nr:hypothetical protein PAPYR_11113 [Paratrimastix pyriformis]